MDELTLPENESKMKFLELEPLEVVRFPINAIRLVKIVIRLAFVLETPNSYHKAASSWKKFFSFRYSSINVNGNFIARLHDAVTV